jgi:hypothetical protein
MKFWQKALPKTGLLFISLLIEVKLFPFIPIDYVDPRLSKELLASLFAAGTILCVLRTGPWAPMKNPYLLGLLFYCLLSPFLHSTLTFPTVPDSVIASLWGYKALWYIILYFLFGWAIASIRWNRHDEDHFRNIFIFLGAVSSIYGFIQAFLPDQFQILNHDPFTQNTTNKEITSFFAHPNFASSFIVITLPFMYRARKRAWIAFCSGVVLMIDSKFAVLGLSVVTYLYGMYLLRGWRLYWNLIWSFLLVWFVSAAALHPAMLGSSGRFVVWGYMWQDLLNSPLAPGKSFLLTGYGLGSFSYLFMNMHGIYFAEAHSLLFEFVFNMGLIGGILLIFSIFWLIFKITPSIIESEDTWVWYCVFGALSVMSFGYFFEHIEPHRYIWCLTAGMLYQKLLKGEPHEKSSCT